MKEQNYLSALVTLILSLTCLLAGFYVGEQRNEKTKKSFLEHVQSERRSEELETKNYIDLLVLLKKGETDRLEGVLTGLTKIRLREPPQLSPWLAEKANEYQNIYCKDECLGK